MRWPWQAKQAAKNDKKRTVRENLWANVDPLGDVEANKRRAAELKAKADKAAKDAADKEKQ